MWSFLWAHWALSSTALAIVVGFVAFGLLGGWPLVLNRRVLGACGVALACVLAALAWQHYADELRAQGAAACAAANVAAQAQRDAATRLLEADMSDLVKEQQDRLAMANHRIDKEQERARRVSKTADAKCTVPRGLVRDLNYDLPGAVHGPDLPQPQTDDDLPAGLALSAVGREVGHNYGECRKLLEERAAVNQRRYDECIAWDRRYGTTSGCTL